MSGFSYQKQKMKSKVKDAMRSDLETKDYRAETSLDIIKQFQATFPKEEIPGWFLTYMSSLVRISPLVHKLVPNALASTLLKQLPQDSDANCKYFSAILRNGLGIPKTHQH